MLNMAVVAIIVLNFLLSANEFLASDLNKLCDITILVPILNTGVGALTNLSIPGVSPVSNIGVILYPN
jgi:hypothetical protein